MQTKWSILFTKKIYTYTCKSWWFHINQFFYSRYITEMAILIVKFVFFFPIKHQMSHSNNPKQMMSFKFKFQFTKSLRPLNGNIWLIITWFGWSSVFYQSIYFALNIRLYGSILYGHTFSFLILITCRNIRIFSDSLIFKAKYIHYFSPCFWFVLFTS